MPPGGGLTSENRGYSPLAAKIDAARKIRSDRDRVRPARRQNPKIVSTGARETLPYNGPLAWQATIPTELEPAQAALFVFAAAPRKAA